MKKYTIHIALLLVTFLYSPFLKGVNSASSDVLDYKQLYLEMELGNIVDYNAFKQAIAGYNKLGAKSNHIITIIDFTKPSNKERLYVFDLKQKKMLHLSHVSHGRKSGEKYATLFSNISGSNKSSLGFFLTENTYQGKHGYSLILHGLEKGINDKGQSAIDAVRGFAAEFIKAINVDDFNELGRNIIEKTTADYIEKNHCRVLFSGIT